MLTGFFLPYAKISIVLGAVDNSTWRVCCCGLFFVGRVRTVTVNRFPVKSRRSHGRWPIAVCQLLETRLHKHQTDGSRE